jgi:hypothetical protein
VKRRPPARRMPAIGSASITRTVESRAAPRSESAGAHGIVSAKWPSRTATCSSTSSDPKLARLRARRGPGGLGQIRSVFQRESKPRRKCTRGRAASTVRMKRRPSMRSRGSNVTRMGPVAAKSESSGSRISSESMVRSVMNDPLSVPSRTVPCIVRPICASTTPRMKSRPRTLCVAATNAPMNPAPMASISRVLQSITRRRRPIMLEGLPDGDRRRQPAEDRARARRAEAARAHAGALLEEPLRVQRRA